MPNLKLSDKVGLEVDVQLSEDSALAKYAKDLKNFKLPDLKLTPLQNVTLDQIPVKSLTTGIVFDQPIGLGIGGEMKIGAGVSGSLKLFSSKDKQLFGGDVFANPVPINANQLYVGVGLGAKVSAELTHKTGDLGFGFSPGSQIALNTFRLFEKSTSGKFPTAVDALKQSVVGFVIPGDLEDLEKMAPNTIATVEGSGSLKFSGNFNVLSVVNPLAVVNLPDPMGSLTLTSAGSLKFGASFEISGAYQIRVQKIDKDKVRLGYYKKRGTEFDVKLSGGAGLSLGAGQFDVLEVLLKAISSNPKVDLEELKKGGLSPDQIDAIKKVVEAGISRKLELALGFELTSQQTSEAAFLFELQLRKLDQAARQAVHDALDGDLSGFGNGVDKLPAGVSLVRSILTEIQTQKHALKLNLLGIFNFISISTLILKGRVMFEQSTGELVITDTATATRIAASTLNFAADAEKLRRVLAESVLLTVAYQCSRLVAHQPKLKVFQSCFELHTKTDRTVLKNNLDVIEALGLMKKAEKNSLVASGTQFGRTTFYAETNYDDAVADNLFLVKGASRSQEEYERAGRAALAALVQPGEEDDFRRLPATNDKLWKEMSAQGQPNFRFIPQLKQLNAARLGAVATDYTVIKWWAEAMATMSERLAELRQFLKDNPKVDPGNKSFVARRKNLAKSLKDVAKNTKSEFGDPWGLVAMDQVSGGKSGVRTVLMGPTLALSRDRP